MILFFILLLLTVPALILVGKTISAWPDENAQINKLHNSPKPEIRALATPYAKKCQTKMEATFVFFVIVFALDVFVGLTQLTIWIMSI